MFLSWSCATIIAVALFGNRLKIGFREYVWFDHKKY